LTRKFYRRDPYGSIKRAAKHEIPLSQVYVLSYDRAAFADTQGILDELGTTSTGLASEEARLRLQKYGPNVLPPARKQNVTQKFIAQFKNLFNILLLVASLLSFATGLYFGDSGSIQMGLAIFSVVVLNAFFSLFQEYRAEQAVQAISRLVPINAKVMRDGQLTEVNATEIVPGDIVVLEEGDRVPADVRLTNAFEVSVDNSILTGESEPQRRFATMTPGIRVYNLSDYQNIVFAGSTIVSGIGRGLVLQTGRNTEFGRIVSLSSEIKEPLSPLQKQIDYTAKINFLVAILVAAVFFVVANALTNLKIIDSLLFAIGVLISLVPEGFQLTVSLSLALTALAMSKKNVVVKRLSSVETLGSTTVMCVDKTGTITSGEMMVKRLWTYGEVFEVTGDGYSPDGFVTVQNRRINRPERPHVFKLFEVAAFCNNAKLNAPSDRIPRWTVLGDPTDGAFLVFAGKGDFNVSEAMAQNPRIGLIPFDSKRRLMTSIHRTSNGTIVAYSKGASNEILSRCSTIFWQNGYIPLDDQQRNTLRRQIDEFAAEGFRVLAMAMRVLPNEMKEFTSEEVEEKLTFLGLAALFDPPRPLIEAAVSEARNAGMRVIMVTGDHELTAEAIAKRIRIITSPEHVVISGSQLSLLSDGELSDILNKREIVFARTTPEQKLRVVRALKAKGETVAVTGDGVNDAPALMEAEVGIAMGVGGTDVARESADMVLLDNNLVSLVEGVKLGRSVFDNLKKFVYYVFTHNWAELATFVAFVLLQVPLPLLVVQVLAIDLGMDVAPSLALIMEPPEPSIMKRAPRHSGTRLIDAPLLLRSLFVGVIISTGALVWAFHTWMTGGWSFGQMTVGDPWIYAKGTTVVLVGIMAGQLGNFFSARTSSESAFRLSPLRNRWLFFGIFAQLAILASIVYIPVLEPMFRTAPLSLIDWIILYGLAPMVLLIEEVRKLLTKAFREKKPLQALDNVGSRLSGPDTFSAGP
jgi:Ca2+-transporting ATPase